jgi:hypothetical protein
MSCPCAPCVFSHYYCCYGNFILGQMVGELSIAAAQATGFKYEHVLLTGVDCYA